MSRRVLLITYYWPPSGGSGVQRWVKFSKYLPSMGWQPVIYTPENPQYSSVDETLMNDIPEEAEIIKRNIIEPYGFYKTLMGKTSSTDMKVLTSSEDEAGDKKSLKDKISLFIRSNFFVPDPRVWWVRPSVRYLKKYLKEHPVDVIITTGPPQSIHLIGQKLHKATSIPWISDFRDPWTKMYWFKKMNMTSCVRKKHEKLEQSVLDESTVVLAVTPFVQRDFQSMTKTPVKMITNGYDEEDFDQVVDSDGFFNITHTGLFPVDGNPEFLWQVLKEMKDKDSDFAKLLRIRLVGKTDKNVYESLSKASLMENVVDLGYKVHTLAVREQMAASVLILPLRNDPEYRMILPGKLFEYLAARRPILGIGQEDGAMAEVIRDTGSGIVCGWDNKAEMQEFILSCWNKFKAGDFEYNLSDIEKYSRRNLTRQLVDLLEDIAK